MAEATLWLDSNVAFSVRKVARLAELAQKKGVRVVVHAQVHLETCRRQRVHLGETFSQTIISSFLEQLGIEVVEARLDRAAAERWAAQLHQRYPTKEDWKQAKLRAVKARLPDGASLPAQRVPMTTDWLIALEAEAHGAVVVVEDKGEEWGALKAMTPPSALSYEEALCWLEARSQPAEQEPV